MTPAARALADAADKAVEGATDQLLWALRFAARDPETGDDLYPGSFVHLSVEDCNLAAATIRDLVAEVERLRAEKRAVIAEDHHNHFAGPPLNWVRIARAAIQDQSTTCRKCGGQMLPGKLPFGLHKGMYLPGLRSPVSVLP